MKEFVIYTGLRLALFVGAFAAVGGVWLAAAGSAPWVAVVAIAFIVSGVGSYFLLDRQRQAFARRVEVRAARMTEAFEERRAREDLD